MRKTRQIQQRARQYAWPELFKTVIIIKNKIWETDTAKKSLRVHDNQMQGGILGGVLEWKKDMT